MGYPPQSVMIFWEELRKANLEKERIRKEYEARIRELNNGMNQLKKEISSQEEMMNVVVQLAANLEKELNDFKALVSLDRERNSSGYH